MQTATKPHAGPERPADARTAFFWVDVALRLGALAMILASGYLSAT